MRPLALVLAVLVATGCGGDSAQTEAGPALPPAPPDLPDVSDLDDADFASDLDSLDLVVDSLVADTLASGEPEADPAPAAPSFEPFLREFKVALQTGRVADLAAKGLPAADLAAVADDADFRPRILSAGADRYRRYGTRREAYLVVGYDADGAVVPEDEAVTESALGLVFDVVDGEYRLVRVERAG
ncbi:MAG: hypothetical protein AAFQ43_01770 [Bacteroidota bacterium]